MTTHWRRRPAAVATALLTALLVLLLAPPSAARGNQLATPFDANNGFAGNSFDLDVGPGGVIVDRIDVNVSPLNETGVIGIWTRPGSAAGSEGSADGWTSRAQQPVIAQGMNNRTPVPASFSLPEGTYGFVVGVADYPSLLMHYTNGGPTVFPNAVLELTSLAGLGDPLLGGGTVINSRIWNGVIHYSTPSQECQDARAAHKQAKKKLRKAKKKLKQAKRRLAAAKASGDPGKIAKAAKKVQRAKKAHAKAKRKAKKAKRAFRRWCR